MELQEIVSCPSTWPAWNVVGPPLDGCARSALIDWPAAGKVSATHATALIPAKAVLPIKFIMPPPTKLAQAGGYSMFSSLGTPPGGLHGGRGRGNLWAPTLQARDWPSAAVARTAVAALLAIDAVAIAAIGWDMIYHRKTPYLSEPYNILRQRTSKLSLLLVLEALLLVLTPELGGGWRTKPLIISLNPGHFLFRCA